MPAPIKYEGKLCKCIGCMYWKSIAGGNTAPYGCHYLLETHEIRGIPPIECYKHEGTPYTPKKRGRPKKCQ